MELGTSKPHICARDHEAAPEDRRLKRLWLSQALKITAAFGNSSSLAKWVRDLKDEQAELESYRQVSRLATCKLAYCPPCVFSTLHAPLWPLAAVAFSGAGSQHKAAMPIAVDGRKGAFDPSHALRGASHVSGLGAHSIVNGVCSLGGEWVVETSQHLG